MAVDQDVEELLIMGDSDLIIRQDQSEWETRDVKLIPYRQHVEDLSKRFKSIDFRYIPRFYNELADALATLSSMLPYPGNVRIDPLEIQIRERHGYCSTVEIEPDEIFELKKTDVRCYVAVSDLLATTRKQRSFHQSGSSKFILPI
uniref:Uncharacterized protein LOC104249404 n=1 Tax=Nicotiana sylvestris TaxID=4096 RepID=A0A1U7YLY3_NICSY|nr:PREDICTED: uncharacterized protein LOC104249404 [Nicotiana sylvestris]